MRMCSCSILPRIPLHLTNLHSTWRHRKSGVLNSKHHTTLCTSRDPRNRWERGRNVAVDGADKSPVDWSARVEEPSHGCEGGGGVGVELAGCKAQKGRCEVQ